MSKIKQKICVHCGGLFPSEIEDVNNHLDWHQKQVAKNHGIQYLPSGIGLFEPFQPDNHWHRLARENWNRNKLYSILGIDFLIDVKND